MKLKICKSLPAFLFLMLLGLSAVMATVQIRSRRSVSLVFAGDIMMDRYFRIRADYFRDGDNPYGFILPHSLPPLEKADFVIANLEAPVSSKSSESLGTAYGSPENFILRMEPVSLELLRRNGISILNTGNNHTGIFGMGEIDETRRNLEEYGLRWFGDSGYGGEENFIFLEKNGVSLCLINYNQFSRYGEETALETLKEKKRQSDVQIIYCHWGEEYDREPAKRQITLAKAFVDAGADLVVGSHPHVIQNSETIAGVPVYYSLGNFIFDQYFSPDTRRGMILEVKINRKGLIGRPGEVIVNLRPDGATLLDSRKK